EARESRNASIPLLDGSSAQVRSISGCSWVRPLDGPHPRSWRQHRWSSPKRESTRRQSISHHPPLLDELSTGDPVPCVGSPPVIVLSPSFAVFVHPSRRQCIGRLKIHRAAAPSVRHLDYRLVDHYSQRAM